MKFILSVLIVLAEGKDISQPDLTRKVFYEADKLMGKYPSQYQRERKGYTLEKSQDDLKKIFDPLKVKYWYVDGGDLYKEQPKFQNGYKGPLWLNKWQIEKEMKMSSVAVENDKTGKSPTSYFTQPQCFSDIAQSCSESGPPISELMKIISCQSLKDPEFLCNVRLVFVSGLLDKTYETLEFLNQSEEKK